MMDGTFYSLRSYLTLLTIVCCCTLGQAQERGWNGTHSNVNIPWVSYLGAEATDRVIAAKTDSAGNLFVCGFTYSASFPVSAGAQQPVNGGGSDAFVAKYSPAGVLLWSTYLGGSLRDEAQALAIDSTGRVMVSGITASTNFPVTSGAAQNTYGGGTSDAYVACYSPTGTLLWATYFGGSDADYGMGIACGPNGRIAVAGMTQSANLPVGSGTQQPTFAGGFDCYIALYSLAGAPIWSSFFGGPEFDEARAVAFDRTGAVVIAGESSGAFPVTAGAQQPVHGGGGSHDAIVASFSPQGFLQWATYLGGSGIENCLGLAADSARNVYVCGQTASANFPVSSGAAQPVFGGGTDGFISSFSPQGVLSWSTFYGGSSFDYAYGLALDRTSMLYIGGNTSSGDFPVTGDAFQPALNGSNDAFLLRMQGNGTVKHATFLGGNKTDDIFGVAVDSAGFIVLAGGTKSDSALATANAHQGTYGVGSGDGFIARIHPSGVWPVEMLSFSAQRSSAGVSLEWTTASESGNAGFTIERRAEGDRWSDIAFLPGGGNTGKPKTYTYSDLEAS